MAIKKIIHCSDIHIKNYLRHEEFAIQLTKFIKKCKKIAESYNKDEVRIVISGDLIHQKNQISPQTIFNLQKKLNQCRKNRPHRIFSINKTLLNNNSHQ